MGLIRKEDMNESFWLEGISNPNILINGDFQVWQRGLGENENNYFNCTNANKYTADRFMVSGEQGTHLTVEKQNGSGMKLVFTDHTLNTSNIRTYFDRDDILRMVGKTYTFSVEYQYEYNNPWSNDFHVFSYPDQSVSYSVIKSKKIEVGLKQIRLEITFRINSIGDDTTKMHIQWLRSKGDVDGFGYHIIRYIKLEEGPIATKFVPRPYGEELALCQRYYERSNHVIRGLMSSDLTRLNLDIKYNQRKRISPSIKFYGVRNEEGTVCGKIESEINFPSQAHTFDVDGFGCIDIIDKKGQSFVAGELFQIFAWEADAEIY